MDLVRCARGVDVGYKEDSTSTTSTSTCIHRYPTFLPFGSSRSDGNRWMLKVYFLPSVEPLNDDRRRFRVAKMHLQEETEGSKEVQGLHFPHLALAFPVACYRLVTNFQETNRQQETHARSVNLRLSRNLSQEARGVQGTKSEVGDRGCYLGSKRLSKR